MVYGVNKAVALGDVFIGPHGFCVGPVEAGFDFFPCGWADAIHPEIDRSAMVDVPYPRGVHPDCAMVIPTHPWLEGAFEVAFILINRTPEILDAATGLTPQSLECTAHLPRDYTM